MKTTTIPTRKIFELLNEEYTPSKFINITVNNDNTTYVIGDSSSFKDEFLTLVKTPNFFIEHTYLLQSWNIQHVLSGCDPNISLNDCGITPSCFYESNPILHMTKIGENSIKIHFTMSMGLLHGFDTDNVNIDIAVISNIVEAPRNLQLLSPDHNIHYVSDGIDFLV